MKSQLYTRTGDTGTTSLAGGERVDKTSPRLEAYGTIDELSANLGMMSSQPSCHGEVKGQVREIQNELFNIGAYLATAVKAGNHPACPGVEGKATELEQWIDALDEQTPKIRAFVLPGGVQAASCAHIARTVCRRAERSLLALSKEEYVDPAVLRYVNRLSDYLFIAARFVNFMAGEQEIIWKQ